jgi:hypothetical protein
MNRRSAALALLVAMPLAAIAADPSQLQIPSAVEYIYVFLQSPGSTERGTGREIASMMSPDTFRKNLSRFVETARRERVRLIITASTKEERWIQSQIFYRGERLPVTPYYNAGIDAVRPGVEVPLD